MEALTWDGAMERIKQRRKSKIESVTFRFGGDYKVHTVFPYIFWVVRWGHTIIGEYDFPEAINYRPESTVTLARARECFEKATVEHKIKS